MAPGKNVPVKKEESSSEESSSDEDEAKQASKGIIILFISLFKGRTWKRDSSENFFTVLFLATLKGDILQLHIDWRYLVLAKKVPVKKAPAKKEESTTEESSSDEEEAKAAPVIKGE